MNKANFPVPVFGIRRHRMGTDGKGVTTLVAFMHCPLRCKYCLNNQCHGSIYQEDDGTLRKDIRMLTPGKLYDIVRKDDLYFQTTGGGICFGGGEPALRADFICEFAKLCGKQWKITIETSLTAPPGHLSKLASVADKWFVDVKDMNPDIYKRYTGSVSQIRENLMLLKEKVPVDKITVKVPHIPDFNSNEDVKASIRELNRMGFKDIREFQYINYK